MSDLRATTLDIEISAKFGLPIKIDIPVTAYADESGVVTKVEITFNDAIRFALEMDLGANTLLNSGVIPSAELIQALKEKGAE